MLSHPCTYIKDLTPQTTQNTTTDSHTELYHHKQTNRAQISRRGSSEEPFLSSCLRSALSWHLRLGSDQQGSCSAWLTWARSFPSALGARGFVNDFGANVSLGKTLISNSASLFNFPCKSVLSQSPSYVAHSRTTCRRPLSPTPTPTPIM